jgi:hypothetical protein
VCGFPVEHVGDSDLYLAFVLREVSLEQLPHRAERHIRCNPTVAQFIVNGAFEAVHVEGVFDKRLMDEESVRDRETRVTQGWLRLKDVGERQLPITEYPLPPAEN